MRAICLCGCQSSNARTRPSTPGNRSRATLRMVRRANAAIDSEIFDAFWLPTAIVTRGFACFISFANGDSASSQQQTESKRSVSSNFNSFPTFFFINRSLAGMNGIELCRRICDRFSEHSPHIVLMGSATAHQDVVEALESGATEYLTTPFDEQELRARLIVAVRSLDRHDNLISSREQFRDQATRDALTSVWNRRGILEILERELGRAEHNGRSTGILMLDLDHFKNVNDAHGHLAGDLVLQETARRLCRKLRAYDRLGRYGGEEFLIVVPATNEKELCELAERIRASTESQPVPADLINIRITLSIGAAMAKPGDSSKAKVIAIADQALYEAKKLGRNRIVFGH